MMNEDSGSSFTIHRTAAFWYRTSCFFTAVRKVEVFSATGGVGMSFVLRAWLG
jgi:hypothetical protein